MALKRKDNPTGVDKLVDRWQTILYNGLIDDRGWSDYESYPRAYKLIDPRGNNNITPKDFASENDYKGVLMNDGFAVTSFFLVSNIGDEDEGLSTATISAIFQADLKKLYPNSPRRFDEELINDIKAVSRNLDARFTVGETARGIDDVYSGFDTEEIKKNGDDHQPYNVVRFDMDVKFSYTCTDEYATSLCTVKVDRVETTPESMEGADDGTATAVITGDQGNLSYAWSNGQTSNPITGLTAGTYSVVVTDDNTLNCTAQGSGVVEGGDPPPVCNLIIDSVVSTGTTTELEEGTATVNFSGNIGAVSIKWQGGQTTNPATNLPIGTIGVSVVDLGVGGTCAEASSVFVPNSNLKWLFFNRVNQWVDFTQRVIGAGIDYTIAAEVHRTEVASSPYLCSGGSSRSVRFLSTTQLVINHSGSVNTFTIPAMSVDTTHYVLIRRISNVVTVKIDNVDATATWTDSGQMRVGRIGAFSNGGFVMGGYMDNVYINDGMGATDAQATNMYDDPSTATTEVGGAANAIMYKMNEADDSATCTDSAGSGTTGTLSGYVDGSIRFVTRTTE